MENAVKRIGVLTSGGDAPGMNACIRAVVRSANARGIECVGIRRGWQGLISGDILEMDNASVSRIINRGGTILYSARCDEFRTHEGQEKAYATCKLIGLDGHGGHRRRRHVPRRAGSVQVRRLRGGHPRHHRQRHRLHRLHHRLRHRGQYRCGVHGQAPRHHAVPRALLRGGGHGTAAPAIWRMYVGVAIGATAVLVPGGVPTDFEKRCDRRRSASARISGKTQFHDRGGRGRRLRGMDVAQQHQGRASGWTPGSPCWVTSSGAAAPPAEDRVTATQHGLSRRCSCWPPARPTASSAPSGGQIHRRGHRQRVWP